MRLCPQNKHIVVFISLSMRAYAHKWFNVSNFPHRNSNPQFDLDSSIAWMWSVVFWMTFFFYSLLSLVCTLSVCYQIFFFFPFLDLNQVDARQTLSTDANNWLSKHFSDHCVQLSSMLSLSFSFPFFPSFFLTYSPAIVLITCTGKRQS